METQEPADAVIPSKKTNKNSCWKNNRPAIICGGNWTVKLGAFFSLINACSTWNNTICQAFTGQPLVVISQMRLGKAINILPHITLALDAKLHHINLRTDSTTTRTQAATASISTFLQLFSILTKLLGQTLFDSWQSSPT